MPDGRVPRPCADAAGSSQQGARLSDRQAEEVAAAALAAHAGDASVALSQLVKRACAAGMVHRNTAIG